MSTSRNCDAHTATCTHALHQRAATCAGHESPDSQFVTITPPPPRAVCLVHTQLGTGVLLTYTNEGQRERTPKLHYLTSSIQSIFFTK